MEPTNSQKLEYIRYVLELIQDKAPRDVVYTNFVDSDVPSVVENKKEAVELATKFIDELCDLINYA